MKPMHEVGSCSPPDDGVPLCVSNPQSSLIQAQAERLATLDRWCREAHEVLTAAGVGMPADQQGTVANRIRLLLQAVGPMAVVLPSAFTPPPPFAINDDFLPSSPARSSRFGRWLNGLALALCLRVLDVVELFLDLCRRLRRWVNQ